MSLSLFRPSQNQKFVIFRFLAEFSGRTVSFITFPLLVRYLGTEAYGVHAMLGAFQNALVPVATLGLGFAVVRLMAGEQNSSHVSARFFSTLILVTVVSSVLALSIILTAPWLNLLFVKVDWATPVIRWSALLVVLTAIELTINDYYRSRLRIVSYSVLQLLQALVYVVTMIAVLSVGGGLLEVVWATLMVKLMFILIAGGYFVVSREVQLSFSLMSRSEFMDMIRFGFPIVIAGIGYWMMGLGDRAIIGYYLDVKKVGIYNAAYILAALVGVLAAPFWGPMYPLMARHNNNGDHAALMATCRKYTNGYLMLGLPALVGLTVLSTNILQVLSSSEITIPASLFGIIALGLFFDQFSTNCHYLAYLHNDTSFFRNVTLISGVFNILLNVVLVPLLGIMGAALATLAAYALLDILLFKKIFSYGYRFSEIYDLRLIRKLMVSTSIMAGAVHIFNTHLSPSPVSIFISILIGVVCYGVVLLAVNGFQLRRALGYV